MLKRNKNKDWRCIVCGRLFGKLNGDNSLKIETKNKQSIMIIQTSNKEAVCKCGFRVTESGKLTKIVFVENMDDFVW